MTLSTGSFRRASRLRLSISMVAMKSERIDLTPQLGRAARTSEHGSEHHLLRSQALKGGMWIGVSVGVGAGIQLLQVTVLARLLSPDEIGLIAAMLVVMAFGELVMTMGLSSAIIQRQSATSDELSSLYWLCVIIGVAVTAITAASAWLVAAFFRAPALAPMIIVLSTVFLISGHGQVARGVLERDLKLRSVAISEIGAAVATITVTVILILQGAGAMSAAVAYVAAGTVRTIILVVSGRSLFRPRWHFSPRETIRFLSFGVFQSLDGIVSFVSANIGAIVTGRLVSTPALGGFTLANTYAVNTPARLNTVVTRVAFPALSQIQSDPLRMKRVACQTIELAGIINAPLLCGLALVAPSFCEVIFGPQWLWIAPLLQVLAIVGLFRALGNPMGAVLMAADRVRLGLIINVAKAILTLSVTVVGATVGGVNGIAWGLVAVGLIGVVLNVCLLRGLMGIRVILAIRAHIVGIALATPMGLAVLLAVALTTDAAAPSQVVLLVAVGVGIVTFVATISLVPNLLRDVMSPVVSKLRGASRG